MILMVTISGRPSRLEGSLQVDEGFVQEFYMTADEVTSMLRSLADVVEIQGEVRGIYKGLDSSNEPDRSH
ncbi:MAG: hypothetical protein QFX31_05105 [Methanothrix sp.]|uniref:hypothetical protein n=1 Tax=Methanothrix sp. TaxID=90426 RepID=UPI0032AE8EC5|nr:hypothetical protein [Methanothrix sp.]